MLEETRVAKCVSDELRCELLQTVRLECIGERDLQQHWLRLFDTALDLGDLADAIASILPVDAELRQDLLAETDPAARAVGLREHIRTLAAIHRARRCTTEKRQWKMN